MGFNTKTTLNGNPELIPQIARRIQSTFQAEGYEVTMNDLFNGGMSISMTKGGCFKAILGMKTALNVTLLPQANLISFEAKVGIFGQQVVPTIIMLFVSWPVIITQIWGLVKQSSLDDKVLMVANQVILEHQNGTACPPPPPFGTKATVRPQEDVGTRFCTSCGAKVSPDAKFCSSCGHKL